MYKRCGFLTDDDDYVSITLLSLKTVYCKMVPYLILLNLMCMCLGNFGLSKTSPPLGKTIWRQRRLPKWPKICKKLGTTLKTVVLY